MPKRTKTRHALIRPFVVAAAVLLVAPSAQARQDAHVAGTGATASGDCVAAVNIHATELGHPGQFLDLWMACGGSMQEAHVQEGPDCSVQTGTTAHLAYFEEQVRITIVDGGTGTDEIGIEIGPFKKAKPKNACRASDLETNPAVGDFVVGLP